MLIFTKLFLRERQSASRGGAEREREGDTESEAGSRLQVVSTEPSTEPGAGLDLTNCKIVAWAKVRHLTNWATQVPQDCSLFLGPLWEYPARRPVWVWVPHHLSLRKIYLRDPGNVCCSTPGNLGGGRDYEHLLHGWSWGAGRSHGSLLAHRQVTQTESPTAIHWTILCATHKYLIMICKMNY